MKIYTKTGDRGETSLYTGERVEKNSFRVNAYGTVDEANSALAMARAFAVNPIVKEQIYQLQKLMPYLMADLASINQPAMITDEHVEALEHGNDEIDAKLPPLKHFVIPGDSQAGAMLDMARTIIRRAERVFYTLAKFESVHEIDRVFLNRLSDYCFMLMRLEDQSGKQ